MTAGARVSSTARRSDAAAGGTWGLFVLLGFSGAIALVYESLWIRSFTGLFGATAPAGAATVSALFAGFAAGSAWFGRRAPRWSRPLRVYALLEVGAGVSAWAVLALQRVYEDASPRLYDLFAGAPSLLLAVKTLQVFVAVFPATFLLGGTLPVAAHAVDDLRGRGGKLSGSFYAVSTIGAVLGALAVPFLLLPTLGGPRSYVLAVAGNLVLGGAAAGLDLRRGSQAPASPSAALPAPHSRSAPELRPLLWLAFASGFLLLGLEVVWVRMLSQVHQNSVHAFSIVLAVFLAAIAVGALIGAAVTRRSSDAWTRLRWFWIAGGLLTLAAPALFMASTDGLDYLTSSSRGGYFRELALVCALSFAPATVCAGTSLPILFGLAARSDGPASPHVGRLLAANTLGSMLGPLVTTFALFPLLGMWGSAVALGLAQSTIPLAWLSPRGGRRRSWGRWRTWVSAAVALLAAFLAWNALSLPRVYLDREHGEQLAWIREGSHGIASVVHGRGSLRLKLDNSYTLGGNASANDARQLGHIPLLLHGSPRRVAFLGLGTGITASAALIDSVDEAVVFELVPEVAEGARTAFAEGNRHVLEDPRVRLVVDDARSHLRASGQQYDVIVGDLVVPWRRGESSLFTREHFAGVRRALVKDGLFCQWLPLYQMSEQEFRIVAATFLDVFPRADLWRGDFVAAFPVLGLIGRESDRPLDVDAVDRRVRALAPTLGTDHRYLVHPAGLWLHWAGSLSADAAWIPGTRRNTLALPWLELVSARTPLADGEKDPSVFTGEPLLAFLEEIGGPAAGGNPADPDSVHLLWRDLGRDLFRASWLDDSGEEERARSLAMATLAELPLELQDSLSKPRAGAAQATDPADPRTH